ncbi:hypothetical protein C8Q72DRAFT_949665 [Fomitopsis betulina]|nr:hypothetical protein C8Q72DRAFT_949665 [Fomitopsis betulina]
MAGPSTRPKNKAQRPGAIVKEYSQQHRSKEELDADRKADAEKKKAAALVRSSKISNLAEIQEHLRQRDAAEQSRHTLTLKVPPKHRQQQISSGPGSANAQDDQQMLESPHELPSVGEYEATLQSDSVADLLANPPTAASMPAPLATIHLPAQATPVAKVTRKEKNSNKVFGIFEQLQDGCPRILAAIKTLTARRKAKGQTSQVVEDVSDIDEDEGPGGSKAQ